MDFKPLIIDYIRARYSIIGIETFEEERVLADLLVIARQLNHELFVWNSTDGVTYNGGRIGEQTFDFSAALAFCEKRAKERDARCLFVFCEAANHVGKQSCKLGRRRLKDFAMKIRKGLRSNVILLSPTLEFENDLQKEVTLIDFPLPGRDEVRGYISGFINEYRQIPGVVIDVDADLLDRFTDAAIGLTKTEIDNSLSRALVNDRRLDKDDLGILLNEKKQIIKKSGILEFVDSNIDINNVGGMENLKRWLSMRAECFGERARQFGIKPPKGVLLTGVPGCGKSLTAKCVAASWNRPLLRLDMGKIFQGIVGSSESNIRLALKTAEAIAPSILWIDEIEKGLAGMGGSGGDGGTSTRVFGTLLTWMQEKTAPVFVFATANNISNLPPELLRKGRFDEIFFVDFPSFDERRKILEIHLRKTGRDIRIFDLNRLAELSGERNFGDGVSLSGAEIEAWVEDSLVEAFTRSLKTGGESDLTMSDFETTIKRIVPMGQQHKTDFDKLKEWANQNAVSASANDHTEPSTNEDVTVVEDLSAGRQIEF